MDWKKVKDYEDILYEKIDGIARVNQLVGRRLDGRQRDSGTTPARQTGG